MYFLFYVIFPNKSGRNYWYIKPMPVIFLFSAACNSLSNMWSFYCNSCMLRKLADSVKVYIISIPLPVIH